jgi:hypothetical protein
MANKRSPKPTATRPEDRLAHTGSRPGEICGSEQPGFRDAQRGYRHSIDEFIGWYCSEPSVWFSRTIVVRYRMHLESRKLAPHDLTRTCACPALLKALEAHPPEDKRRQRERDCSYVHSGLPMTGDRRHCQIDIQEPRRVPA